MLEKVPEQAKEAIQKAIEMSSKGQERALEALQKEKGPNDNNKDKNKNGDDDEDEEDEDDEDETDED